MRDDHRPALARREALIQRYARAVDAGDMETIDLVLQAAEGDPELDRLVSEVNQEVHDVAGLGRLAHDAAVVRALLRQHLPSGFAEEQPATPVTVGEVAARLVADRSLPPADRETGRGLLGSSVTLPADLSRARVEQLAQALGAGLSERFWRRFRDAAIMLTMGQAQRQIQLAATRQARERASSRDPGLRLLAESTRSRPTPDVTATVGRLLADAGLPDGEAEPEIVPLEELIARFPVRVAEAPGLTWGGAAELLAAETGQRIDVPDRRDTRLSGFLYCLLHADTLFGCILVDRDDPIARRRFSAAHELGHYLLHFLPLLERGAGAEQDAVLYEGLTYASDDEGELPTGQLSTRIEMLNDRVLPLLDQRAEDEANQFAAEVLMPASVCRAAVARARARGVEDALLVRRLAGDLMVSRQAMFRRLTGLGLLEQKGA